MNKKAVFGALLATAAVVLVASIMITATISAKQVHNNNFAEQVLEMKKEWNNARYLLDKATSDYIADNTQAGCTISGSAGIQTYFDNAIAPYSNSCSYSLKGTPEINGGDIDITITLTCEKTMGIFSSSLTKDVSIMKQIVTEDAGATCYVKDRQSNVTEVAAFTP